MTISILLSMSVSERYETEFNEKMSVIQNFVSEMAHQFGKWIDPNGIMNIVYIFNIKLINLNLYTYHRYK